MKKKLLKSFMVAMVSVSGLSASAAQAADFPSGYPFNFWGEARSGDSKTIATGRLEQGVEITKLGQWGLIPFSAIGGSYGSKKSEYWNNELVPEVGIKLTHPLKLTKGGWGSVSFGFRQRWDDYFDKLVNNDSRTEVFMQLGFGGDWK
ncbi:MAG: hypothetical protein WCF93_03070 [Candidatus Moraniibacteriota bacterium]